MEGLKNIELNNVWKDETEKYSSKIINFLVNVKEKDYDDATEVSVSGMNSDVRNEIMNGSISPEKIEVLYLNNNFDQIKVLYKGGDKGSDLDIIIRGIALEDFLNS